MEIGVVIDLSTSYGRGVLRGAGEYLRRDPRWGLSHLPSKVVDWDAALDDQLRQFAGVIVQSPVDRHPLESLAELRLPAVCVADHAEPFGIPTVRPDHRAVGVMAAQFYLRRGFRHLAYVGRSNEPYSCLRHEGFAAEAQCAGMKAPAFWIPEPAGAIPWGTELKRWLLALAKPVGLLACDDSCARATAFFARQCSVAIPDQVALLGVDDDPEACEMDVPHLSSIMTDSTTIGRQAARILAGLLTSNKRPRQPVLIPPIGVTVRQSTDTVPTSDQLIQRAVNLMRERCENISGAQAVADLLQVDSAQLEARMVAALGRSVSAELRRIRVEKAKQLLRTTDLPAAEIARQSGFSSAASFARDFHQQTGLAPVVFRRRVRGFLSSQSPPG